MTVEQAKEIIQKELTQALGNRVGMPLTEENREKITELTHKKLNQIWQKYFEAVPDSLNVPQVKVIIAGAYAEIKLVWR
jgi:hypothetical protein